MLGRSHKLRGLITAAAAAVAAAAFAIPASADSSPCTPPAGADGWYCAALLMNNANAATGVTDRLVDDYFRDAVATSAPTSEGIVDDSWRSPVLIEGAVFEEVGGIVPHVTLRSIANDEQPKEEVLVDRPEIDSKITRVSGPFVVEGVQQSSGGFNWGDFGIGVAVAVGAMLLAMGVSKRAKGQGRLGIGRA